MTHSMQTIRQTIRGIHVYHLFNDKTKKINYSTRDIEPTHGKHNDAHAPTMDNIESTLSFLFVILMNI